MFSSYFISILISCHSSGWELLVAIQFRQLPVYLDCKWNLCTMIITYYVLISFRKRHVIGQNVDTWLRNWNFISQWSSKSFNHAHFQDLCSLIKLQKIALSRIKKLQGVAALSLLLSQSQQYYVLQLFYFYSYKLSLEWLRTFGSHPIPSTASLSESHSTTPTSRIYVR
jgi:hypothetical protein